MAPIIEKEVADEDIHIDEFKDSSHLSRILSEIRPEIIECNEKYSSAVLIEEKGSKLTGIRVDLFYDIYPVESGNLLIDNPNNASLEIFSFVYKSEFRETTAYVLEGQRLIKEIVTDDNLIPSVESTTYDRDIYLNEKEF